MSVYNKLASGGVLAPRDLYGFKVCEVTILNLKRTIGIGIWEPSPKMKVYFIDEQYEKTDVRRYKDFLTIGYRVSQLKSDDFSWDFSFNDEFSLTASQDKFREIITANFQVMYRLISLIEEEESLIKQSL